MKLTLVLTHQCDLACAYCYSGRKFARSMEPHLGQRAIDRALDGLAPDQTLTLGFFGGEPLLAWPLARDLSRYARARARARGVRLALQLTTNGTHLSPDLLDQALLLGVDVTVSMDGLPAVHDAARPTRGGRPSSAAALAAIDLLRRRSATFQVNMVVRPEGLPHLADGARFLADRGAAHLLPSLDYGADWRPEHGPALRAAIAGLRRLYVERFPQLEIGWLETKTLLLADRGRTRPSCGVGQGEVAVAPSGRHYPCERLVGEDAQDLGFGHVDDDGPLRVDGLCSQPAPDAACGDCGVADLCTNDCACANLARTGRADLPDGLICLFETACLTEAARALQEVSSGRRRLPVLEVQHA